MSIFRDLRNAVREGLDDLLNAGPARDDVDDLLAMLEGDLAEARAELDLAIQDGRRLSGKLADEQALAERLQQQAQQAVDAGDDERGRERIRRRRRALRGVEILEQQERQHERLTGYLRDHIDALEDKLQELRLRRDYFRTRSRVQSLRERYERYQREYPLDDALDEDEADGEAVAEPGAEARSMAEAAERAVASGEVVLPEAPLRPRRRRQRMEPDSEQQEPAAQPLAGHGELPPQDDEGPALRPLPEEPEELPEPEPRNLRREREALLAEIERRTTSAEAEAAIEEELRLLKAGGSGPPVPPALSAPPAPPVPPAPAPAEPTDGEPGH
ncbi:MAG: PspA/IM30 family protein [Fimbriimonadaceae bacterium]|nr:PspA/IM30 family protein [Fimbriimonadaceae bacterium]